MVHLSKHWFGVLFSLGAVAFALVAKAQGPEAGDAAHFLRDGLGARAQGMGGAYVAIADDVTASYWNPAGLVQTPSSLLGGTYESRHGGLVEFQYLGGVISWHSLGTGLLWFHSDLYSIYFLSAAGRVSDLSFGLTSKLYNFSSGLQSARGIGLDVGGLYRTSLGEAELAVGLISADIGWSTIRWQGTGFDMVDHVAWVNRLGVALSSKGPFGPWCWAADLEVAFRRPPRSGEEDYLSKTLQLGLDLGVEAWFQIIALRAGLSDIGFDELGGLSLRPSVGVGVRVMGIAFDAAWTPTPLGHTYLLSMEFAF